MFNRAPFFWIFLFSLIGFLLLPGCPGEQTGTRYDEVDLAKTGPGPTEQQLEDSGFFSVDRSIIQILNDFEKPLNYFPIINSEDGEYGNGGRFYRVGVEGPFSGRVITRDAAGRILAESIFHKGIPHGPHRKFYENGEKAAEIIFDQGTISGVQSKWWTNGKIKKEEYWSGGQYYGSRSWDEGGRLIRQIYMPKETASLPREN